MHAKTKILTRKMKKRDLREVMRVEFECFPNPWSPHAFIEDIRYNEASRYMVATLPSKGLFGKAVVGFIGWWQIGDTATILRIATAKDFRRMGVASTLLEAATTHAHREGCKYWQIEVRSANYGAIDFYKDFGFEEAGRLDEYYENPKDDALILTGCFENLKRGIV